MTNQLTIFSYSGLQCNICRQDPGQSEISHWEGFLDADTGEFICNGCRSLHYAKKALTPFRGFYSEMPVPLPVPLAYKS